jgi:hypothetical protein
LSHEIIEIDLSGFQNGIYILQLKNSRYTITEKIVNLGSLKPPATRVAPFAIKTNLLRTASTGKNSQEGTCFKAAGPPGYSASCAYIPD